MTFRRLLHRLLPVAVLAGAVALISWLIAPPVGAEIQPVALTVAPAVALPWMLARYALRKARRTAVADAPDEPAADNESGLILHYDGLPLLLNRPLMPDERASLARIAFRARLRGWVWILLAAAYFLCICAVLTFWETATWRQDAARITAVEALLVLLVIAGTTLLYLSGRGSRTRAQHLRRTLNAGYVRRFEGYKHTVELGGKPPESFDEADRIAATVSRRAIVELFPHDNEIYSIDGAPRLAGIALPVPLQAPASTGTPTNEPPIEWSGIHGRVYTLRRCSPEERREIAQYAGLGVIRWLPALAIAIGFLLLATKYLALHAGVTPALAVPAVFISMWAVYMTCLWDRARNARNLLADSHLGWAWTIQSTLKSYHAGKPHGRTSPPVTHAAAIERLAISGRIWTIDGTPAFRRHQKTRPFPTESKDLFPDEPV